MKYEALPIILTMSPLLASVSTLARRAFFSSHILRACYTQQCQIFTVRIFIDKRKELERRYIFGYSISTLILHILYSPFKNFTKL